MTDYGEHFFLAQFVALLVYKSALLNDNVVQFEFHLGAFDNSFFDCLFCDEPEDLYSFLLTNSVSSVHGLQVHLRIPIGVENDDNVRGHQIDAQTSSSGAQNENELV